MLVQNGFRTQCKSRVNILAIVLYIIF